MSLHISDVTAAFILIYGYFHVEKCVTYFIAPFIFTFYGAFPYLNKYIYAI